MIEYFTDKTVDVIHYPITEAPDANGEWLDTRGTADPISCLLWTASTAQRYFNTSWGTDIVMVMVVGDVGTITADDEIVYGGVSYWCNDPDNIAMQGEDWVIGLRAEK